MLGEKLMQLRKKQGMSQQELADILNVTRQTVSNWECEQGAPTLDKAKQLSEIYHMSLDDIIENEVEIVTKKGKEPSSIVTNLIGKVCKIYGSAPLFVEGGFKILDVNDEWIKVEYQRTKENAFFKKEKIIKYIDLSTINGFCILQEEGS